MSNALKRLISLRRDTSGNIAVIFTLSLIPIISAVGAAVDYSVAMNERTKVQAALDSAMLAGSAAGKAALDNGLNDSAATTAATAASQKFFQATINGLNATLTVSFAMDGRNLIGSGRASGSAKNAFMTIIGQPISNYSVASNTSGQAQPYLNVYLLIDISASMLLPSTQAGINQMIAGTGCALACHDNASNNDTYGYALNKGIQLRYQVVNQGIQKMLDYLNSKPVLKNHVKVGLWSFDDKLRSNASMTYNYSQISSNFPAPTVATDEEAAATPFNNLIDSFISAVGPGGDGTATASPQKMVIIATDGVNDPTRAWTWNTSLRNQVRVFDTSFCSTFKTKGVKVAIINTPYLPMTWDWGYQATLGQPGSLGGATRVDDIPIALKNCAGPLFTVASDVQAIQNAFVNIFALASPIRITN